MGPRAYEGRALASADVCSRSVTIRGRWVGACGHRSDGPRPHSSRGLGGPGMTRLDQRQARPVDPWHSCRYPVSTRARRVLRTSQQARLEARREGMAKAFNLKPLEDRIVVRANEEENTTSSGIVIPDTAKEKPQEGTVVAVGPGRFEDGARVPLDVAVGDTVIYSKYGGTEVKVEGDEYLILSARDVLAVVGKK